MQCILISKELTITNANFYTSMTNYTDVPKANEQSETCTLLEFLSETLSSAKTILRATDSKNNSYYSKNTVFFT